MAYAFPLPLLEEVLGNSLAPFRFLTPFSIRSSRRLRNSLRSDILAARLCQVPSKSEFRRLNLQWSLQLFPKTYASNTVISYYPFGNASNYGLISAIFYLKMFNHLKRRKK
jgi:hypothetical protein